VPPSAPRIDPRLVKAIVRLDRRDTPIAETNRRVGEVAGRLGLPKPSYEQVRAIVHAARNSVRAYGLRDAAYDVSFRTADPRVVAERLIKRAPVREHK
jgi:hypothetical protein